jgi:hypothetical protein
VKSTSSHSLSLRTSATGSSASNGTISLLLVGRRHINRGSDRISCPCINVGRHDNLLLTMRSLDVVPLMRMHGLRLTISTICCKRRVQLLLWIIVDPRRVCPARISALREMCWMNHVSILAIRTHDYLSRKLLTRIGPPMRIGIIGLILTLHLRARTILIVTTLVLVA